MEKEEEGKFSSMMKGIDMDYVSNIPITDNVAEWMNSHYFKDPLLVAKKTFERRFMSPQFERKNVFGHYSIKTAKEREMERGLKENKRYGLSNQEDLDPIYNTPRKDNHFSQSLLHPSNEMFETKLRQKQKGGTGVSIMSGEFIKPNKLKRKVYDQEKVPYAGASIDLSQPNIYRYEIQKSLSRNNPMAQSMNTLGASPPEYPLKPEYSTFDKNYTFSKSKNATLPKRTVNMDQIYNPEASYMGKLEQYNSTMNHNTLSKCTYIICRPQTILSWTSYKIAGVPSEIPDDWRPKERI